MSRSFSRAVLVLVAVVSSLLLLDLGNAGAAIGPGRGISQSNSVGLSEQGVEAGQFPSSVSASDKAGFFVATNQRRLVDTRTSPGFCINGEVAMTVAGRSGIPDNVSAVALTITVVGPSVDGYMSLWSGLDPRPSTSTMSYLAGETLAKSAIVKTGLDGSFQTVRIFTSGGCPHILIDVNGWFARDVDNYGITTTIPGGFNPLSPRRVLDTRNQNQGPCVGTSARRLTLAGTNGVGAMASAVAMNITVVGGSTGSGSLSIWSSSQSKPSVTSVDYIAGKNRSNSVIAQLGGDGSIFISSSTGCPNIIIDLYGWFAFGRSDGGYSGVSPARAFDSNVTGPCIGTTTRRVTVAGSNGVPNSASSVLVNVTVSGASSSGFLSVWRSGTPTPTTSNVNFTSGAKAINSVIVPLGPDGSISLVSSAGCPKVQVDVIGWFAAPLKLAGAVQVAVGSSSTCAAGPVIEVYCWGRSKRESTWMASSVAESVTYLWRYYRGPSMLSVGTDFGCTGDQCWTFTNSFLDASDYDNYFSTTPTKIAAGTAYGNAVCALSGSQVFCWGDGTSGQVGNGTWSSTQYASKVAGITTAVDVSASGLHACAALANGTARCWGLNATGQLGDRTKINSPAPVTVQGLSGVTKVATSTASSCAIVVNGQVKCWGGGLNGELGNGTKVSSVSPVTVSGVSGAVEIEGGNSNFCARLSSGQVKCWGDNTYGQLGNGTKTSTSTPVVVSGLSDATDIGVGAWNVCAVVSGGGVVCWGSNSHGQVGNGNLGPSETTPQKVLLG